METKIETEAVPDWLQWVVSQEKILSSDQQEPKKASRTKKSPSETSAVQPSWVISEELTPKNTWVKSKKETVQTQTKSQELWDDGMDIPDWLQAPAKEEKTPAKKAPKTKKTDDFWTLDSEDNSSDATDQK